MADKIKRINLKASLQTETLARDIVAFGDDGGRHIQNTGIERDGGVKNLLIVSDNDNTYDETYYCSNGKKARINYDVNAGFYRAFSEGQEVGQFPKYGIKARNDFNINCDDAYATADGKIITTTLSGSIVKISEYSLEGVLLRSKNVTVGIYTSAKSSIVKKDGLTYDNISHIAVAAFGGITWSIEVWTVAGVLKINTTTNGGDYTTLGELNCWEAGGFVVGMQLAYNVDPEICLYNANYSFSSILAAGYLVPRKVLGNIVFSAMPKSLVAGTPLAIYSYNFQYSGGWVITPNEIFYDISSVTVMHDSRIMGSYFLDYLYNPVGLEGYNQVLYYENGEILGSGLAAGVAPELSGAIDSRTGIFLKSHSINGEFAYISLSWDNKAIGALASEIGEVNQYVCPSIIDITGGDYFVFFKKASGGFVALTVSDAIDARMQEIAPGVVKVNTVSAQSIIDTNTFSFGFDYSAYNGAGIFGFLKAFPESTPTNTDKQIAIQAKNKYSNSVDAGNKIAVKVDAFDSGFSNIPELEKVFSPGTPEIDVYVSNNYLQTYIGPLTEIVLSNKTGTLYVEDNRIGPPIGAIIKEKAITLADSTAIRDDNYLGYRIANEVAGDYVAFILFAQLYIFDGERIYLVTLTNGVVSSKQEVAEAKGLVFLAVSPTVAYFVSSYDNSIFTFDGGRSVNKILRMSQKANILAGVYNTRGNELALYGTPADPIIWIRDGVITENVSPFVMMSGDIRTFSTIDGIWFSLAGFALRYAYKADALPVDVIDCGDYPDVIDCGDYPDIINCGSLEQDGAILPLTLQTAYFGADNNNLVVINQFQVRLYSDAKALETISILYYGFDQDKTWTQALDFIVGDTNNPWDDQGYAYIKFSPERPRALAGSLQISSDARITILEANAYIAETDRNVPNNKG